MDSLFCLPARKIALLAVLLVACPLVWAQEPNWPRLPLAPDYSGSAGWNVVLGAEFEYGEAYDGASEYGFEAEPFLVAHARLGRVQGFLEGNEVGVRSRAGDRWLLTGGLRYEGGRDEEDSARLTGLGEADSEFMGVAEIRYAFDEGWRYYAVARGLFGRSSRGSLGIFALGRRFASSDERFAAELVVFATTATAAFINADFGITSAQAQTSRFPATELGGGFSATRD